LRHRVQPSPHHVLPRSTRLPQGERGGPRPRRLRRYPWRRVAVAAPGDLHGRGPGPLRMTDPVLGWDIGGANVKAALVGALGDPRVVERPFALWREPRELPRVLREVAGTLGGGVRRMAVTMTAELADCFAT